MVHGPQIDPQRIEGGQLGGRVAHPLGTLWIDHSIECARVVDGSSVDGTQDMQPLLRDRAVFHQRVERQTDDPRGWREPGVSLFKSID